MQAMPTLILALTLSQTVGALAGLAQHSEPVASTYLSNLPMSAYRLPVSGLTINYPLSWKVEERPDKDTLLKISGTVPENLYGALTVSTTPQNNLTLPTFSKMLEEAYLSKQPGYQKLSENTISFGRDHKIVGLNRVILLGMAGNKITQRWVIFPAGADFVCMTFLSPTEQYEKIAPLFNDMLLKLTPASSLTATTSGAGAGRQSGRSQASRLEAAASTAAGTKTGAGGIQYTSVKVGGTPVAFSYPKHWQVEETGDLDHPLKISSKNGPGSASEISLYSADMPPNITVDYMLGKLEEKVYSGKKNYRLISRQSASFGSGPGLDGMEQEISFDHNGVSFKQRLVSFVVKDKFYLLSLISTGANDVDDRMLFGRIKASLAVKD